MIACTQWASLVGSISLVWAIIAVYAIWRFTEGRRLRNAIRLAIFDLRIADSKSNGVETRLHFAATALDTLEGVR